MYCDMKLLKKNEVGSFLYIDDMGQSPRMLMQVEKSKYLLVCLIGFFGSDSIKIFACECIKKSPERSYRQLLMVAPSGLGAGSCRTREVEYFYFIGLHTF